MAIYNRLQEGRSRVVDSKLKLEILVDEYFEQVKAKGRATKTVWKYRADLDKLRDFCREMKIRLCRQFTRTAFYDFKQCVS